MPTAGKGLNRGQIAALVVASVTIFLIALSVAGWRFIVRRRQYCVEELPKRDMGASPDGTVSQTERNITTETRQSIDTSHSSIWGGMGRSIVPASSFSDDVWDSRIWPLPPGHSERYTFFSERSSTTVDDTLEIERWSIHSQEYEEPTTARRLDRENRCDGVRGISYIGDQAC
ncbi:hypothetical protein M426DRAFT_320410 [Hypoxylon sp. CI-4A]|nr:hypothetical protein M426DRAFT_320410 [Hypoxylon sp. CI-4A]